MNSIAVIISTDKPKEFLQFFFNWGPEVDWSKSTLILINSGEDVKNELMQFSIESGIAVEYLQGLKCPISKRNEGARIADNLGLKYVVFLNDYQRLEAKSLQNFLVRDWSETVIIGKVKPPNWNGNFEEESFAKEPVLNKDSSLFDKWDVFSRVSESGLIINTSYFIHLGGWAWANRGGRTFVGGDGFLILARTFVDGQTIGTCNNFRVLGGHQNPHSNTEIRKSKAAMYSYAFTIATMFSGVPKWIALRFIAGRIFRIAQFKMSGKEIENFYPGIDLAARLRALFRFQPSKLSKHILETGLNNCSRSGFACSDDLDQKCIFR
jgi:hypothetical protein